MVRRRFHCRRGRCSALPLHVVRRPSALARNLCRNRGHVVTFDAELPSKKVRQVRAMLLILSLMNQSSMAQITLLVLASTQQAQPALVGAAALLS